MAFHSGFVCILGRPNAGKSTLLNALVGEKLAIISPKPQTTRNRILGIIHVPKQKGKLGGQVVLIDTPGVHRPDTSLGRKMMAEVREAMVGCELVLLIVDVTRRFTREDHFVLEMAKKSGTPVFLLLNKIDLLRGTKEKLLPIMDEYRKLHEFREIIPLSARKHEGLDVLLDKVLRFLPEGPRYFPEDQVTDQPVRFMVAEIIREQVLVETEEEVPYATTVVIEQFEEGTKVTRIAAMIYCERERTEGHPGGQRRADAQEDRHRGPPADRKDAGKAGVSRALRQGPRKLAGVARVCRGTRLAAPGGAPGRQREAMSRSHLAQMQ